MKWIDEKVLQKYFKESYKKYKDEPCVLSIQEVED